MKHRINSEPKKMSCYSALSIENYSCLSSLRRKRSCKVQETILGVTGSRGRDCFSAACRQGTCSNLLCFWHSWIPLFPDLGSPHRTKHFVFHTLLAGQYIWQSGESSLFMWTATLHLSQEHVTVYPKLIGCLPLNWLKPLALKSLVHFMYFSISKEKRWSFHKAMAKTLYETQLLWKSIHQNNEALCCHEHTLLLCPKRQSSVEIYNDSAFLETARIFSLLFSKVSILRKAEDADSSNGEKHLLSQLEGI